MRISEPTWAGRTAQGGTWGWVMTLRIGGCLPHDLREPPRKLHVLLVPFPLPLAAASQFSSIDHLFPQRTDWTARELVFCLPGTPTNRLKLPRQVSVFAASLSILIAQKLDFVISLSDSSLELSIVLQQLYIIRRPAVGKLRVRCVRVRCKCGACIYIGGGGLCSSCRRFDVDLIYAKGMGEHRN